MKRALQDALLSLEGLALGDAFGQQFMQRSDHPRIQQRRLPESLWRWTDDTHMALSLVENLARFGRIEQDALAAAFAARYVEEPGRGYGAGAARLLKQYQDGGSWRKLAPRVFRGGSYGNGAAMRAAPIGAYFGANPGQAAQAAADSAVITHTHPDGVAGAQAVAAAAAIAIAENPPTGQAFLQMVAEHVPAGEVRDGIKLATTIDPRDWTGAVKALGNGTRISAQDTVPFCLWIAAHLGDDYAEALWQTVAALGDCDTTGAIVGGIVALRTQQLPPAWLKQREPLPAELMRLSHV